MCFRKYNLKIENAHNTSTTVFHRPLFVF